MNALNLFYSTDILQDYIILSLEESIHCSQSLRQKKNDIIHITDGNGNVFKTKLNCLEKKQWKCEILEKKHYTMNNNYLHIAIAPTKNINRLEWFVEKSIEIGVNEFSFIICKNSERKAINLERLSRISISSMKQSLQYYLPIINPITKFSDFISKKTNLSLYIATSVGNLHLAHYFHKDTNACVVIGPEGNFTQDEIENAINKGFTTANLGSTRLRTETAGLITVCLFQMKNFLQ